MGMERISQIRRSLWGQVQVGVIEMLTRRHSHPLGPRLGSKDGGGGADQRTCHVRPVEVLVRTYFLNKQDSSKDNDGDDDDEDCQETPHP